MMHLIRLTAAAMIVVTAAGAAAQTTPAPFDMKGTWKGNNEALVDGPATHHPPGVDSKAAGPYRLRQQTITYKFDGQDGKRFWGTMSSEQQVNIRMLGTLSADNKWIYMVSKEGYLDGQIIDPDTIEMCYRHVNETSAVVGCNIMKRVK
jgi:hypothetical protein